MPAAESLGLGVLAWSPLGRGLLTGKYRHSTPSESRGASPQWQGFIDGLRSAKSDRIVEAVITAAEGLGTTPAGRRAGLGARPARASSRRSSARAPPSSCRPRSTPTASGCPPAIRTALEDVSAPPFGYPERRPER